MKIGIVTTWFERGAAYVSKQFKEVWEEENQVFIYARGGEGVAKSDSNWSNGNITYGKRYDFSILDIIDIDHFKNWIESNELDVVFFNEQHLWEPIVLCNSLGVKTGSYIDYYTKQTVPFFRAFDFLICNTKRHFQVFDWHPQVFYVPWGTDTELYNKGQRKSTNPNEIVFFHSAGMNPYRKGCDYVIKAFSQVNSDLAKLIIHTQTDLINFFPELAKTINSLIGQGKLEVIHKTVTAPGLYHLGDVYVYPSRLEGIGLTIAEASACGMPVITTDMAPMNEFVQNDVNGKLVKVISEAPRKDGYYWNESELDVVDLEHQINFFIERIGDLEDLKDNSYTYAQKNLSWSINSKALNNVVHEIQKFDRADKSEVIKEILAYEKTRGWWYYFANTKAYQGLKRIVFNSIKRLSK